MIGGTDIYEAMDDSFESWCLLVLEPRGEVRETITGWHLGFGNTAELVRIESETEGSEQELISLLSDQHLDTHRGGDVTTTIITPFEATLPRIRRRCLECEVGVTFRGLRHLSLEELVTSHLGGQRQIRVNRSEGELNWLPTPPDGEDGTEIIRAMWDSMNQIGPLLPYESLQGRPL